MAKKALINKAAAKPKFKVRGLHPLPPLRPRPLGLPQVRTLPCVPARARPRRRDPRSDEVELVRRTTMLTDPIADMLTRIRNANTAMHDEVRMPSSKQKVALAKILEQEGYIDGFDVAPSTKGPGDTLTITMKYSADRDRTISGLRRISTPGLRVYRNADHHPPRARWPRCGRPVHQPRAHDRPRGARATSAARSSATSGDRERNGTSCPESVRPPSPSPRGSTCRSTIARSR
jgi:small subunit ribosomal protein S8